MIPDSQYNIDMLSASKHIWSVLSVHRTCVHNRGKHSSSAGGSSTEAPHSFSSSAGCAVRRLVRYPQGNPLSSVHFHQKDPHSGLHRLCGTEGKWRADSLLKVCELNLNFVQLNSFFLPTPVSLRQLSSACLMNTVDKAGCEASCHWVAHQPSTAVLPSWLWHTNRSPSNTGQQHRLRYTMFPSWESQRELRLSQGLD